MENMNELKEAIIMAEHIAHENEKAAALYSGIDRIEFRKIKARAEKSAKLFRIAAACMWEKLERLEKEAGTC